MKNLKIPIAILIFINTAILSVAAIWGINHIDTAKKSEQSQTNTSHLGIPNQESATVSTGETTHAQTTNISTVKKLIENALMPVGSTMYIYGGGWNEKDTGAGESAVTIGLSPKWKTFAEAQGADYDSSLYRYQIEKGLDCSGYIGWVIYNTLEHENNKPGYVFLAQEFADRLSEMELGTKSAKGSFSDYQPGDILSSDDCHVWIAIGQCEDGSVVFVHSSPPGVSICGTVSPDGTEHSMAVQLAEKFMSERFPLWYEKYPGCSRNISYLHNYNRFRWHVGDSEILSDPDDYCSLTPEEILTDIFLG